MEKFNGLLVASEQKVDQLWDKLFPLVNGSWSSRTNDTAKSKNMSGPQSDIKNLTHWLSYVDVEYCGEHTAVDGGKDNYEAHIRLSVGLNEDSMVQACISAILEEDDRESLILDSKEFKLGDVEAIAAQINEWLVFCSKGQPVEKKEYVEPEV